MRKIGLLITLLIFILSACSEEEQVNPNDRFDEFISLWSEEKFDEMYDMFSSETKSNFTTEDSIERMEKIYSDLGIDELEISFTELSDEEVQSLEDQETPQVTLPFSVEMNSIAGPITYDYEGTLVQEIVDEEEEEADWFIEWDTGFIHPELKDGGQVSIETVTPERGEILDRNQMPLAMNDTVYQMGVVPENLENEEEAKEQIADILNISVESIDEALNESWVEDHLFVPLATILPTDESTYEQLMAIPGIQRWERTGRIYPGGEATGHLLGYIGDITAEFLEETDSDEYGPNDQVGRRGLEKLYEERLKGKRGVVISIQKEDDEEIVIAEKPVEHGENIQLTIDINTQEIIYDSYEEESGTTAAIDPVTGETLALVSAPSFNPNDILYGKGNVWGDLEENELQPLLNRYVATFAPGSVLKPITAAAGMNAGTLDPEEGFEIEGKQWSNGEGWGDYEVTRVSESDGPVDLMDAMIRSDNIYFAMQAVEMGGDTFVEEFKRFGFGEELPYEYPIVPSSISNSGELNDEVLLANSSYGQGELEMSAIHLAATYTPFLNDGNLIKPTLLLDEETGEIWQEALISSEDAEIIGETLRGVITDGTARHVEEEANIPLAGKTGTVELKLDQDTDGSINSWFVAYPYEPKDETENFLMAMLVEDTGDKESGYAVNKFVDVINELYPEE
jgi:penicillin-binding protein